MSYVKKTYFPPVKTPENKTMRLLLLMPIAISCVPPKGATIVVDNDTVTETNDENEEDSGQADVDSGQPEDSDIPDESSSNRVLNNGIWLLTESTLVDDPCNWLEEIPKFGDGVVSLYLGKLLPERFDVEAFDESFNIKAKSYRAQDFIECEVDEMLFSCETQTATASYYFDGFTYYIDFTGRIINNNTIQGEAVVNFGIDGWWVDFLDNYEGLDVSQCTQTLELTIEISE